jgi:DMSO/TMAO reductase YedYZ molybdopterin-dependent catalytic subunit
MQGVDEGKEAGRHMAYERSLPMEKALHDDTLLAYEMNGQPLWEEHGAPLRAIVPGWYGMASVKWLRHIKPISEPFTGFFQQGRYRFERPARGDYQEPVDRIRIKSLILWPRDGASLPAGEQMIEGVAWAGERAVGQVLVSADCGARWHVAHLLATPRPYAWTHWRYVARLHRGEHTLMARAVDEAGEAQRLEEDWNYRGYANSAVQPVHVVST